LTPAAATPAAVASATTAAAATGTSTETSDFNAVLSPLLGAATAGAETITAALLTPEGTQTGAEAPVASPSPALPEGLDLASVLQQTAAITGNALPSDGKGLPVVKADPEAGAQRETGDETALPVVLSGAGVIASAEVQPAHQATAATPRDELPDDELLADLAIPGLGVATVAPAAGEPQPLTQPAAASTSDQNPEVAAELPVDRQMLAPALPAEMVTPAIAQSVTAEAASDTSAKAQVLATAVSLPDSRPQASRNEAAMPVVAASTTLASEGVDEAPSVEQTVADLLSVPAAGNTEDNAVKTGGFGRLLEAQTASSTHTQQPAVDTSTLGGKSLTGAVAYRMEGNTQVATALVNQPLDTPQWSNEIGERVVWFGANKIQHAEIELDPPELGPLQVRISTQNDQTSVTFTSHHAAVREVLDQSLPRLKEMFSEQGLNLVQADVGERRGSQQQQQFETTEAGGNAGSDDEPDTGIVGAAQTTKMRLGLVDAYA
jgi:flagellar hook-length control protein FliK